MNDYVKKWNYQYKYYNKCNKNVYWCKLYMVYDALNTNLYDYVIWLDSDTYIKDLNIDLGEILNKYDSDIFIGTDNSPKYDITNAGVFIIKNTITGINFVKDCINYAPSNCFKKNGQLNGRWAASCYEQGVMNLLIADKYSQNTTMLNNDIIYNYNVCNNDVFIMHLYASSDKDRTTCFTESETKINYLHK